MNKYTIESEDIEILTNIKRSMMAELIDKTTQILNVLGDTEEGADEHLIDFVSDGAIEAVDFIFKTKLKLIKSYKDNKTFYTFYDDKVKIFEWGLGSC